MASITRKETVNRNSGTVTVDVDKLISNIANLIDSKIEKAIGNAQAGKPIYERSEQTAPVKQSAPVTTPVFMLGDIEVKAGNISKHGNRYAGNVSGYIIDEKTGSRYYIVGARMFESDPSDEIKDSASFIAHVIA